MLAWWQHCSKLLLTSALENTHGRKDANVHMSLRGYTDTCISVHAACKHTYVMDRMSKREHAKDMFCHRWHWANKRLTELAGRQASSNRVGYQSFVLTQPCLMKQVNELWWTDVDPLPTAGCIKRLRQHSPLQKWLETHNVWFDARWWRRSKRHQCSTL